MQLTKEQLMRIFSLYEGFGWQPGMLPPEITTVEARTRCWPRRCCHCWSKLSLRSGTR